MRKLLLIAALVLIASQCAFAGWTTLYDNGGTWTGTIAYVYDITTNATSFVGIDLTVTLLENGTWDYIYSVGTSYDEYGMDKTYKNIAFTFNGFNTAALAMDKNSADFSGAGVWNDPVFGGRRVSASSPTGVSPVGSPAAPVVIFSFNSRYAPEVGNSMRTAVAYGANLYTGNVVGPDNGKTVLEGYGMPPTPTDDVIPEPTSIALGAMGLVSIMGIKKFRR